METPTQIDRLPAFKKSEELFNSFLETSSDYLSLDILFKSNQAYVQWFEGHSRQLALLLPDSVSIYLTGSRSFGLAYPESDIDFAIVSKDQKALDDVYQILDKVYQSPPFNVKGGQIWKGKTNSGRPAFNVKHFFKDDQLDIHKLDISFRTREIHEDISSCVEHSIIKVLPTNELRERYINVMRFLNGPFGDQNLYSCCKDWLRVLSP